MRAFSPPSFLYSEVCVRAAHVPPALFILALEPLAAALRSDPNITGISYVGESCKVNLFADDALLTLTNPITILPNLYALLSCFTVISGLQINAQKTIALNIPLPDSMVSHFQTSFPYRWADSSLEYLGIGLTSSYTSLFAINY